MRKVYFGYNHSASLEPAEINACSDCDEWLEDCTCDLPSCDGCGERIPEDAEYHLLEGDPKFPICIPCWETWDD
jgi:hypothetical protein